MLSCTMINGAQDAEGDPYTGAEVRDVTTTNWKRTGRDGERVKQVSIPAKVRDAVVDIVEKEPPPPPPPGPVKRTQRHCKSRWFWYLVGLIRNGSLQISTSENNSVYNGQRIGYFEDVLNSLVVTASVCRVDREGKKGYSPDLIYILSKRP